VPDNVQPSEMVEFEKRHSRMALKLEIDNVRHPGSAGNEPRDQGQASRPSSAPAPRRGRTVGKGSARPTVVDAIGNPTDDKGADPRRAQRVDVKALASIRANRVHEQMATGSRRSTRLIPIRARPAPN